MSDSSAQLDEIQEFELIDGIHELRQRRVTCLWYRSIQLESVALSSFAQALPTIPRIEPSAVGPMVPVADQLAEIARIAIAAGKRAEAGTADAPPAPGDALAWRVVPGSCPALMLSASPTLGGQMSEAQFAPGARFRIEAITNGVAEVLVQNDDGEIVRGYCNTVDLACADPDRVPVRLGSAMPRLPKPTKFKISNLGQTFGAPR